MSRGSVNSERVLAAAGLSQLDQLHRTRHWQLWRASFEGPAEDTVHSILTINASCGWAHLKDARAELDRQRLKGTVTVVSSNYWTKALNEEELERASAILQIRPQRITTQSEFLFRVLHRTLGKPVDLAQESEDPGQKYFIEPSILFPTEDEPGPALKILFPWLAGREVRSASSTFGVLLGDAGCGKSTVAKRLFDQLSQGGVRVVPLLVESKQWAGLSSRSWLDLTDIWSAAISTCYPGAMIGPDRLQTFLASGTVIPILDGFDELCSLFPGAYNPNETLRQLFDMCDEGNFLLTSRTRFWHEHIPAADSVSIYNIQLEPFTTEQRDRYIDKRYPESPSKRGNALKILERIRQRTRKWGSGAPASEPEVTFDTIPFVVMFATESADVEVGDPLGTFGELLSSSDPLEGLVLAFCHRESVRQKITLSPKEQLKVFQTLASELGELFTADDVRLALAASEISDIEQITTELSRHDLLEVERTVPEARRYRFKFPFVYEYCVAKTVVQWLLGRGETIGARMALRRFADRRDSLVEGGADLIRRTVDEVDESVPGCWTVVQDEPTSAAGFFHLLVAYVRNVGATKREATSLLFKAIGQEGKPELDGLELSGTVGGLDLSHVRFKQCKLENIEFSGCTFSPGTRFESCKFLGSLNLTGCEGFGQARFLDCVYSENARATIQVEQKEQDRIEVTPEQIVAAVRDALGRFRRGHGYRTRRRDGIENSMNNKWTFGKEVLAALEKFDVLDTFDSHGNAMYRVADTSRATTLLDNGACVGSVNRAVKYLGKRILS